MQARLLSIRAKLDRLRAADAEHRVFGARRQGAYGHEYREKPRLDSEGILREEAACGTTFPDELREFLMHVHGGGAGPGFGFDFFGHPARTARPFGPTRADLVDVIARRQTDRYASIPLSDEDDEDDDWPPGSGFLQIAQHGCGVTDVLVVTGELRGMIWCCDMAWRPYATSERSTTFLDWYEEWLDRHLPLVGR